MLFLEHLVKQISNIAPFCTVIQNYLTRSKTTYEANKIAIRVAWIKTFQQLPNQTTPRHSFIYALRSFTKKIYILVFLVLCDENVLFFCTMILITQCLHLPVQFRLWCHNQQEFFRPIADCHHKTVSRRYLFFLFGTAAKWKKKIYLTKLKYGRKRLKKVPRFGLMSLKLTD